MATFMAAHSTTREWMAPETAARPLSWETGVMPDSCLGATEIEAAGLAGWWTADNALRTRLATGDFATGLRLVNLIGEAAERVDHHPDLDLRYAHVDIHLYSHDSNGVTHRDVSLARQISELAARLGVPAARP
jgi:4a-hydroxytetrahydrobiopterin dehydratase